jgi:hypothetical protein
MSNMQTFSVLVDLPHSSFAVLFCFRKLGMIFCTIYILLITECNMSAILVQVVIF